MLQVQLGITTIPIPLMDRGHADPQNKLGILHDCGENDMCTTAVRGRILTRKYFRNQFACVHKGL